MNKKLYLKYFTAGFLLFSWNLSADQLTIIATSDFHGQLQEKTIKTEDGTTLLSGGAARLAGYIKHLQEQVGENNILLDAGDLFQGSLETNYLEGSPVVDLYNHLNVSAVTIGNHEFDFGPSGPSRVVLSEEDDQRGALKDRMKQADFPFLSINILKENSLQAIEGVQTSVVIQKNLKVGVIGAIDSLADEKTFYPNVQDLVFPDPTPMIIEEAKRLREDEKVDLVVLLYHAGEKCTDTSDKSEEDISSCSQNIIFPLIDRLPTGLVNLIIGGDTHQLFAKKHKGVAVLQPGAKGQGLAWATVSSSGGKYNISLNVTEVCDRSFLDQNSQRMVCNKASAKKYSGPVEEHLFLNQPVPKDPWVKKNIVHFHLRATAELKQKSSSALLIRDLHNSRTEESPLGNWFTDKFLNSITKEHQIPADFSVLNNGGFRNSLYEGSIKYGHFYNVLPFDDTVTTISVNKEQIEQLIKLHFNGPESFSFSHTLAFQMDENCEEVIELKLNEEPVVSGKQYIMVTNDYLANGGSGFKNLNLSKENIHFHYDKELLRDLVFTHLLSKPHVTYPRDFFSKRNGHYYKLMDPEHYPEQCKK